MFVVLELGVGVRDELQQLRIVEVVGLQVGVSGGSGSASSDSDCIVQLVTELDDLGSESKGRGVVWIGASASIGEVVQEVDAVVWFV